MIHPHHPINLQSLFHRCGNLIPNLCITFQYFFFTFSWDNMVSPLYTLQIQQPGLDAFKSFNFTQLVNPSFHITSSISPFVVIFGFTFPFAKVVLPSEILITIPSFLWSMILSKKWNILPLLSTWAYMLSAMNSWHTFPLSQHLWIWYHILSYQRKG